MEQQRRLILDWAGSGQLAAEDIDQALSSTGAKTSAMQWQRFAQYALLFSGIIALSSGVIFFFAYNWDQLGKFQKFALLETLFLVAALVFSVTRSRDRRVQTALTLGLFFLTGALLALIGQTYQTGADTWQLFATWALLGAPFMLVGRSSVLWIAGLAVAQIALFLHFFTFRGNWWWFAYTEGSLVIALTFNTLTAAVLEVIYLDGTWSAKLPVSVRESCGLQNRIAAQLSVLAANVCISSLLILYLLSWKPAGLPVLVLYAGWIVSSLFIYRFLRRDLALVAGSVLSVVIVSVVFAARLLLDNGFDNEGSFILLALITLGISTPAVLWLKKLTAESQDANLALPAEEQPDAR